MVSEAIFPTNWGYICIEKWSQIFVSGIGSVHSESEEKSLFKLKRAQWGQKYWQLRKYNSDKYSLRIAVQTKVKSISLFCDLDSINEITFKFCQLLFDVWMHWR